MNIARRIQNRYILSKSVANFGFNNFEKIRLFVFVWASTLLCALKIKLDFKFTINANGIPSIIIMSELSDAYVFSEVFVKLQYYFELKGEPQVIFDIGSNVGYSVIYFKTKYPKAVVYAFEPSPIIFKKLERNCQPLIGVTCLNVAVTEIDGTQNFFIKKYSSPGSSLIQRGDYDIEVPVVTRSIESLMRELNINMIDLIKFDVEGSEYKIFKECKVIPRINNLIGELHIDIMGATKEEFVQIFKEKFIFNEIHLSKFRSIVTLARKQ